MGLNRRLRAPPCNVSGLVAILALFAISLIVPAASAADVSKAAIALLAARTSVDELGAEGAAAWQMAQKFGVKTLILPRANGRFVDAQGNDVKLDQFRVIWHHEGDAADALGLLG